MDSDNQLNEAITALMTAAGISDPSPEELENVKTLMKEKVDEIIAHIHFCGDGQDPEKAKTLRMTTLKAALRDMGTQIDRPDYLVAQPFSKMTTRRPRRKGDTDLFGE